MAGKKRSGLANDRRAYGCGRNYTTKSIILMYNTYLGVSFVWGGVIFTRNIYLPNYSYVASITYSTPSSQVPNPAYLTSVIIDNSVTRIGCYSFM